MFFIPSVLCLDLSMHFQSFIGIMDLWFLYWYCLSLSLQLVGRRIIALWAIVNAPVIWNVLETHAPALRSHRTHWLVLLLRKTHSASRVQLGTMPHAFRIVFIKLYMYIYF